MFRRAPKPLGSKAAATLIRQAEDLLQTGSRKVLQDLATTIAIMPNDWRASISHGAAYLQDTTSARAALRDVRRGSIANPTPSELHFLISSVFLRECWEFLTGDEERRERMALITGPVTPQGSHVLSSMQHVALSSQSASYVQADPGKTNSQIVKLVEHDNHEVMSMWHSHIMKGPATTKPSATDLANQKRMEAIGWRNCIGGIFNLSGHIRLFSTCRDFSVTIYGNRCELLEETPRDKLYKLAIDEV